jgi:Flp pilus assembly protein TadB
MSPAILMLFILTGALVTAAWVRYSNAGTPTDTSGFDQARLDIDGFLDAGLLKLAVPVSATKAVQATKRNSSLRALEERVRVSRAYGGSLEVFVSVQIVSLLVASAVFIVIAGLQLTGLPRLVGFFMAAILAVEPWRRVGRMAAQRTLEVNEDLPVFVDLFLMPVASGLSLESALRFTVDYTDGPVATQVRWLLDTLQARTLTDELAFREAGSRLGTPEAAAFFTALAQAHIEGSKVLDTLQKQAAALRIQSHQRRRARIKVIPVKMIVAFALHFLPLIFIVAFVPLLAGLQGVGR